jgi:hypothetical protein
MGQTSIILPTSVLAISECYTMICFPTIEDNPCVAFILLIKKQLDRIKCKSHPYETILIQLLTTNSKHDMITWK